ncbi:MAG TPA: hypothetical protein VLC98_09150 [Phnomibacter sp.]|nr:hypothetical protein [Phnomibacter sp.]
MKKGIWIAALLPISAFAQNVGIGTNTPTGPLTFANTTGNKIVLWGDGNTSHYGLGIQSGVLQLYADLFDNAVAIGYGRSASFQERMRIQGNGNIGIGTSTPGVRLDVAGTDGWNLVNGEGDMRIGNATHRIKLGIALGGGGIGAAGIMQDGGIGTFAFGANKSYLIEMANSKTDNTGIRYVNFPNNNAGLRVNGNAGTAGQVLTSGGSSAAPYWATPAAPVPPQPYYVVGQSAQSPDLINNGPSVDIPGMVASFTLAASARVVFNYNVRVINRGCALCGDKRTFVNLVTETVGYKETVVYTPNAEFADCVSGPVAVDLGPGSYNFKVHLVSSIYGTATVYATLGKLSWQVFPL